MKLYYAGGEAEIGARPEKVGKPANLIVSFGRYFSISPNTMVSRWIIQVIKNREETRNERSQS